ncbi:MAG: signal peptidase I [Coprobacillus sp.]
MKIINRLASILFVLLMIVVIPLSVPKVFGFSIYNVLSDSMEPTILTGSLIYVKAVDTQTLKPQDIISFYAKSNTIVTHRITNIEDNSITTKGDYNKDIDLTKLNPSNIIGKVMFSIPILGYIYEIFGNIGGMTGLFVVLLFIMLLWLYSYNKEKKIDG